MTETPLDNIISVRDICCTSEDFLQASLVLNNPNINISSESVSDILAEKQEEGDDKDRLARILEIAKWVAMRNNIQGGTPTTSDDILRAMGRSDCLKTKWIARIVSEKMHGIILPAPVEEFYAACNAVQEKLPSTERLSIELILLLAKIQQSPLNMKEVTEISWKTTAASTGKGDRLENLGYIERKHGEDDRRQVFLVLTNKGKVFLQSIMDYLNN